MCHFLGSFVSQAYGKENETHLEGLVNMAEVSSTEKKKETSKKKSIGGIVGNTFALGKKVSVMNCVNYGIGLCHRTRA